MRKTKKKASLWPQPDCPRCFRTELRPQHKKSFLVCRNCDYRGHWRQFFEGTREREEVQKLFKKGILEGKEFIDTGEGIKQRKNK